MTVLDAIRRALGRDTSTAAAAAHTAPSPTPEPQEIRVPELTGADLTAARQNGGGPLILDCREDYEWQQGRIPGSLHIPMRQIPGRVAEIGQGTDIVVVCAHGNRSYSVAGWLIANGFTAASLRGGLAEWQSRGGEVKRG